MFCNPWRRTRSTENTSWMPWTNKLQNCDFVIWKPNSHRSKSLFHIVPFLNQSNQQKQKNNNSWFSSCVFENFGAAGRPKNHIIRRTEDADTHTEGHLLAFWPLGSGFHTSQREDRACKQVCVKKQPGQQLKAQQHSPKTTSVVSPVQPLYLKLHRHTWQTTNATTWKFRPSLDQIAATASFILKFKSEGRQLRKRKWQFWGIWKKEWMSHSHTVLLKPLGVRLASPAALSQLLGPQVTPDQSLGWSVLWSGWVALLKNIASPTCITKTDRRWVRVQGRCQYSTTQSSVQ